jgi:hypothetical protein
MALVSDRLRRRDDIARVLGAPVGLSAGDIRLGRWRPAQGGLKGARGRDMQRIIGYLGEAVPVRSRGTAALAVVPVDDTRLAAASLVSLAVSCARQGKRVVVADLCRGAPAARLLDAGNPGIGTVNAGGTDLTVVVPDRDDVAPAGPFHRGSPLPRTAPASQALAAACATADLLLTLVALDPSLGAGHLPTWATDAVTVITAGRSSATRIHAVGEMIRLAGTTLAGAVLVGADPSDESLGATQVQPSGWPMAVSPSVRIGR